MIVRYQMNNIQTNDSQMTAVGDGGGDAIASLSESHTLVK